MTFHLLNKQKGIDDDDGFYKQWTLDHKEVELQEEISRGAHSIIYKGMYRGTVIMCTSLMI